MNFLDQLTETQKDMLVSLPYRVGLWISQSDDAGGDESDEQELQTLSNIINGFARDVFSSEMLQYIMAETLGQQDKWEDWAHNVDHAPTDCALAIDIIKTFGTDKDVAAFQNHMMEIGEAVAMAFSEYELQQGSGQFIAHMKFHIENFKATLGKTKKKSIREFLSISSKERQALSTLAEALGTTY